MTPYDARQTLLHVGLCLGLEDPGSLADFGTCRLGGLSVTLMPADEPPTDRWVVHFDLGEIQANRAPDAMAQLLRLNHLSGSKTTGVFALSPLGWSALYTVHFFNVSRRSPQAFAQAIEAHARTARSAMTLMLGCSAADAPTSTNPSSHT